MYDKKLFKETFGELKASENTLTEVLKMTTKQDKLIKRKLPMSALVAAVIAALFTITAMAGITLAMQKQDELRGMLDIEGKDIPEYEEYTEDAAIAATPDEITVTVLSSMRDKQFVRYYILVSPVTLEQVQDYIWFVCRDGKDGGRSLALPLEDDSESAYDADTQSLMLEFPLQIGTQIDADETEEFELKLRAWDTGIVIEGTDTTGGYVEQIDTRFTVSPNTSEISTVTIEFGDGIEFTNPETGEVGIITKICLSSGGAEWFYTYDGAERQHYSWWDYQSGLISEEQMRQNADEQLVWLNAFDDTIRRGCTLNLSDGSQKEYEYGLIPNQNDCEDGVIIGNTRFYQPLDLSMLESITVNGMTYYK